MKDRENINVSSAKVAEFCRWHYIRNLSFFGSFIRDDFRPDSDIDVLVEFERDHIPGLIRLTGMEIESSKILGHKVDLSRYFRQEVVNSAEVVYAQG